MVDGKNPEPLEQVPAMIFVKITLPKTNMTTENKKYTSFLIGDGDTSSTRMVEVDGGSNPLNHWNKSWPEILQGSTSSQENLQGDFSGFPHRPASRLRGGAWERLFRWLGYGWGEGGYLTFNSANASFFGLAFGLCY